NGAAAPLGTPFGEPHVAVRADGDAIRVSGSRGDRIQGGSVRGLGGSRRKGDQTQHQRDKQGCPSHAHGHPSVGSGTCYSSWAIWSRPEVVGGAATRWVSKIRSWACAGMPIASTCGEWGSLLTPAPSVVRGSIR